MSGLKGFWNMIHTESDSPFSEYLEALNKCCQAVQLTAFHTLECAKQTKRAATQASLAVYHVKECLDGL